MSTLILDVETLPLAASMAAEYPAADRLPPSNYSKPEAIASWREKDKASWSAQRAKECALTPRLGRIACLGFAVGDSEPETLLAPEEGDEKRLLELAWGLIGANTRIVTFNGRFDLQYLVVRSMVHDLTGSVPVADWFRRYSNWPHFDCRAVLTGWDDRQTGKLHEWCASFGIPVEDVTTGADIYELAQRGDWQGIASHCRSDIALTRALYRKISPLYQTEAA